MIQFYVPGGSNVNTYKNVVKHSTDCRCQGLLVARVWHADFLPQTWWWCINVTPWKMPFHFFFSKKINITITNPHDSNGHADILRSGLQIEKGMNNYLFVSANVKCKLNCKQKIYFFLVALTDRNQNTTCFDDLWRTVQQFCIEYGYYLNVLPWQVSAPIQLWTKSTTMVWFSLLLKMTMIRTWNFILPTSLK